MGMQRFLFYLFYFSVNRLSSSEDLLFSVHMQNQVIKYFCRTQKLQLQTMKRSGNIKIKFLTSQTTNSGSSKAVLTADFSPGGTGRGIYFIGNINSWRMVFCTETN